MNRREKNISESKKHYSNLLEKEMSYSEDLRNQENINFYVSNLKKLEDMSK